MTSIKRILYLFAIIALLAMPLYATEYYVKNGGNDAASGLDDDNAWETIAKVNGESFSGDDIIYFKRGDTWREQLTVPDSGTSGHQIAFRAYGEGAKPIINGADSLASASWTEYTGIGWTADFEENNFSEFAGEVDTGGDLSVTDVEAKTETYSMAAVVDDNTDAYVYETANLNGSEVKFSFYFKFSSVASADWVDSQTNFLVSDHNTGGDRYRLYCRLKADGQIEFKSVLDDDDAWGWTGSFVTDTNWHKFEVHIKYDTGGGGYHKIWFDDGSEHGSTSLTTTHSDISGLRFGSPNTGGSWVGNITQYFDDIVDESGGTIINTWYNDDLSDDPGVVWLDGASYPEATDKDSVDSTNRWYWDNGNTRLYIYATENPTGMYSTIEPPTKTRAVLCYNKQYIEFHDIHFKYAIDNIIQVAGSSGGYNIFDGCTFTGSGTSSCLLLMEQGDNIVDGCTIYGENKTNNVTNVMYITDDSNIVQNCVIRNGGHSAFMLKNGSGNVIQNNEVYSSAGYDRCFEIQGTNNEDCQNNIIRYNYFHDSYDDGIIGDGKNQFSGNNNQIYYNIFANGYDSAVALWGGDGLDTVCYDNDFYNNIIYGFNDCGTNGVIYIDLRANATGNKFYNNIISGSDDDRHALIHYHETSASIDKIEIKNNCIHDAGTSDTVEFRQGNGESAGFQTVAYMETNYSTYWANNIIADPLMTDPGSDDFTLQVGSPCINRGTFVGLLLDYLGLPVPIGHRPDIGAYEHKNGGAVIH